MKSYSGTSYHEGKFKIKLESHDSLSQTLRPVYLSLTPRSSSKHTLHTTGLAPYTRDIPYKVIPSMDLIHHMYISNLTVLHSQGLLQSSSGIMTANGTLLYI